mmetsp:Transcript_10891/g.11014  ORF Transcript_10891/g.11014 Transcript_10891/m.11014 type:complete len:239 (+) Transcript_10891:1103-1819(+)
MFGLVIPCARALFIIIALVRTLLLPIPGLKLFVISGEVTLAVDAFDILFMTELSIVLFSAAGGACCILPNISSLVESGAADKAGSTEGAACAVSSTVHAEKSSKSATATGAGTGAEALIVSFFAGDDAVFPRRFRRAFALLLAASLGFLLEGDGDLTGSSSTSSDESLSSDSPDIIFKRASRSKYLRRSYLSRIKRSRSGPLAPVVGFSPGLLRRPSKTILTRAFPPFSIASTSFSFP